MHIMLLEARIHFFRGWRLREECSGGAWRGQYSDPSFSVSSLWWGSCTKCWSKNRCRIRRHRSEKLPWWCPFRIMSNHLPTGVKRWIGSPNTLFSWIALLIRPINKIRAQVDECYGQWMNKVLNLYAFYRKVNVALSGIKVFNFCSFIRDKVF